MIVVFGSINLDLNFAVQRIPGSGETVLCPDIRIEPGGKRANQAVAAARDGARVVRAGTVGRDALAAGALRFGGGARLGCSDLCRIASRQFGGRVVLHACRQSVCRQPGRRTRSRRWQFVDIAGRWQYSPSPGAEGCPSG